MACFVDPPLRWGKQWCHLMADTPEELEDMRKKLGLKPEWLHMSRVKGVAMPHYDLVMSKRNQAINHGAIELSHADFMIHFMGDKTAASGLQGEDD